jgi:signal peptidase II
MTVKKIVTIASIPLIILADQICKWWVIEMLYRPRVMGADGASLGFGEWLARFNQTQFPPISMEVTSFFNMVMVWNHGVSFGLFASAHDIMPYVLSGVALIIVIIMSVWMIRATSLATLIPLAMIIAGALGNVWDRLRFGAVADFFDFHAYGWHYPAFNIADCCIVVGVIFLAIDGLFLEPRRLKKKETVDVQQA